LADNCQSWELHSDGAYMLRQPQLPDAEYRAQSSLLARMAD